MKTKLAALLSSAVIVALSACSEPTTPAKNQSTQSISETKLAQHNPLLAEFTGPYGGVPAFDKMDLADLKLALE